MRGGSSTSNLLKPPHCRAGKVGRVLSHKFGLFASTELSLTTSLQGTQGVEGADALVQGGSSTSNLLAPSRTSSVQRQQGVSSSLTRGWGGSALPNFH